MAPIYAFRSSRFASANASSWATAWSIAVLGSRPSSMYLWITPLTSPTYLSVSKVLPITAPFSSSVSTVASSLAAKRSFSNKSNLACLACWSLCSYCRWLTISTKRSDLEPNSSLNREASKESKPFSEINRDLSWAAKSVMLKPLLFLFLFQPRISSWPNSLDLSLRIPLESPSTNQGLCTSSISPFRIAWANAFRSFCVDSK